MGLNNFAVFIACKKGHFEASDAFVFYVCVQNRDKNSFLEYFIFLIYKVNDTLQKIMSQNMPPPLWR